MENTLEKPREEVSDIETQIDELKAEINTLHENFAGNAIAEHLIDLKAEMVESLKKIEILDSDIDALAKNVPEDPKEKDENVKQRAERGWEKLSLKKNIEEIEGEIKAA